LVLVVDVLRTRGVAPGRTIRADVP